MEAEAAGERIRQAAHRVARRIRWNFALERLATGLFCAAMLVAVVLTLWKLGWLAGPALWWTSGLSIAAVVVWVATAAWSSVDPVAAAHRLDRQHDLDDRLSTALSLLTSPDEDVDRGFVRAQLNDAAAAVEGADPAEAAPLEPPRDAAVAAVGVGVIAALALVQPPDHTHTLPEPPDIQHGVVLDDTSIALARDRLEELQDDPDIEPGSEASKVIDELAELLDQAEDRDISAEAFTERLGQLESQLEKATDKETLAKMAADLRDLADKLQADADSELDAFPELKDAAKALEVVVFEKAADQLDKLAKSLAKSQGDGGFSDKKRRQLSKLLERMGGSMSDKQLRELYENNKSLADKFDAPNSDGRFGDGEGQRRSDDRRAAGGAGSQEENRLDDNNNDSSGSQ
jgi:hypothetical protein